ncbi:MAG TPA: winged helix-turn-helix transcriptional regulator [Bacilli bacterium]|nr:winged helix-turn-helix transcriptional regulator [Bacilli bacterium]
MLKNAYFSPTTTYKEFIILDLIEKNSNITQRELSNVVHVSVSTINDYIETYEQKGYLKRNYITTKTIQYLITDKGIEHRKLLNLGFLNATQKIYDTAKNNIIQFLTKLNESGFRKILLYGAGEVAEILLQVIKNDKSIQLEVVGIIDDNVDKIGKKLLNTTIVSIDKIDSVIHDGILISSYTHHKTIYSKLVQLKYNPDKILEFFTYI